MDFQTDSFLVVTIFMHFVTNCIEAFESETEAGRNSLRGKTPDIDLRLSKHLPVKGLIEDEPGLITGATGMMNAVTMEVLDGSLTSIYYFFLYFNTKILLFNLFSSSATVIFSTVA
jgi:hypothetical protein